MPRSGEEVRRRLQLAALELYRERGYEETTATEIAERAGVTERTFFRHFPDKREVLFDGEAAFIEALTSAVRHAAPELGTWDTLFLAFNKVKHIFVENRPFTEPRRLVIVANPALQERALAKTRVLTAALASVLEERGVPAPHAHLSAQMGMATLSHAVAAWFADGSIELGEHIVRAFHEVRDLSSSSTVLTEAKQTSPRRPRKSKISSSQV